jgi:ribosome biogenesis GTPase
MLEHDRGVIEAVLPRTSDLSRRAAGSEPLRHTLVANVDQAVIVFAAAEPRADLFMLDRFLVAAVGGGLEPLLCVNKADLADPELLEARFAVYRQCGFRLASTSAVRGDGLAELREALTDRRSVICGPSGVGKSSLLNAIAPGLHLRTSEVGEVTHKGRHTTSAIALLPLPFGGWVADTPGLRQLSLLEVTQEHLAAAFPDVAAHLGRCRYSNCSHLGDPGCGLQAAVASGDLERRRLKSFLQMGGR